MLEKIVHNIRFYNYEPEAIHCMAYDCTSEILALSRADSSIEIWNCKERPFKQFVIFGKRDGSVEALAWSKGRLFSGGLDGFVVEYNLLTKQALSRSAVTGGPTWCIATSPQGDKLAAGTEGGYICLFDITEEGLLYDRVLDKQEGRILSLAWHKSGEYIVTGSVDFLRLWSLQKGQVTRFSVGRSSQEKETIVWCVSILDDMTIVTGDSRGKTCFWDSSFGTLLDGVQTHKADVLTMQVAADQSYVIVAGVDPVIVQVDRVETRAKQGRNLRWIKSVHRQIHTHDVRALAMTTDDKLFSGGVDTYLAQSFFPPKTVINYPATPQPGFLSIASAAPCLLLRYERHIELWRLGSSDDDVNGTTGTFMSMTQDRVKLLELHCRDNEEQITCCTLSPKAQWIAYLTGGRIRIYRYHPPQNGGKSTVQKIRESNEQAGSSNHIVWLTDGILASASHQGNIQLIYCSENEFMVKKTLPMSKSSTVNLMTVSEDGKFLATVGNNNRVTVFNWENETVINLPKCSAPATALAVNSRTNVVIVVYADHNIIEFCLNKQEYTQFSRHLMANLPGDLLKRNAPITNVSFDPQNTNLIMLHDISSIIVLDKSKDTKVESPDGKGHKSARYDLNIDGNSNSSTTSSKFASGAFTFVSRSNHILHFSPIRKSELISVELNPILLEDKLPPALKVKKFGAV